MQENIVGVGGMSDFHAWRKTINLFYSLYTGPVNESSSEIRTVFRIILNLCVFANILKHSLTATISCRSVYAGFGPSKRAITVELDMTMLDSERELSRPP